jgi:hypothetical protein
MLEVTLFLGFHDITDIKLMPSTMPHLPSLCPHPISLILTEFWNMLQSQIINQVPVSCLTFSSIRSGRWREPTDFYQTTRRSIQQDRNLNKPGVYCNYTCVCIALSCIIFQLWTQVRFHNFRCFSFCWKCFVWRTGNRGNVMREHLSQKWKKKRIIILLRFVNRWGKNSEWLQYCNLSDVTKSLHLCCIR